MPEALPVTAYVPMAVLLALLLIAAEGRVPRPCPRFPNIIQSLIERESRALPAVMECAA
ncbi:hypothetical protein MTP06_17710 [Streptomyces sp. PLM4]|uniref:Uncharacterized protein n=1 Tax=Streptomyces albidoflavus TaxID=1886 RepID=A0AA37FE17_9ACTN|nr:hypothetical protein MTP06_17710 [Streptomyces sp. PLM4]GHI48362.1 hypothetical protein ScoT_45360 [Streptomyces albidoflavus]